MIKSTIFYIFLILWTFVLGLFFLPLLFFPYKYLYSPIKLWIRGTFFLLKSICNLSFEIRGEKNISRKNIKFIASKHQSAFETLFLYNYFSKVIFIHKYELFFIPIFGMYLKKLNMVSINRKGGSKALIRMINETKEKISKGCTLIIFPEGTRKLPGSNPDYKSGVAGIYKEINFDVLPIALNSGFYWPKNSFKIKSGKIIIEFLPIIKKGLDKNEFIELLENNIEKKSAELKI